MKRLLFLLSFCLSAAGMQAQETNYRPLVHQSKVWRTGINSGNGHLKQYEYRFFEDTIIGDKTCKILGKSELEFFPGGSYRTMDTLYVGALYEEGRKVYCVRSEKQELELLYDFASPVGADIEINGELYTIIRKEKSQDTEFKGYCTYIQRKGSEDVVSCWMEGVGGRSNLLESLAFLYPTGLLNEILISCSEGDETIYLRDEGLSIVSDVKKQWLDFTHTTKPRPKAPGKNGQWVMDNAEKEKGGKDNLTGEYSARELFVNLKTLTGAYSITLTNAAGTQVYQKEVQTSCVVALNTDLTNYAEGTYTLRVENSEELYTAVLTLPLIETAVRDLNSTSVNYPWTDLSGRRFAERPTRKGLYIRDGRKVIIN